jgi:peptidoglycan hydrolase-like protein with peptidoglycan-binding domain
MLKKFLIGTMALALMLTVVSSVSAFSGATLKQGSKGADVIELQTLVGATPADGKFGPMTKAKVIAWQTNNGLKGDGVFGPASMAKAKGAVSGNFPEGCTSAAGFSSTTGKACSSLNANTFPVGCTSAAGFSATTGAKCDGSTTGTTPTPTGVVAEGYMTLQSAPVAVVSSVGQSEKGDAIMAFSVKAKGSDIKVQRVNVHLTSPVSALPWKYFTNLSLYNDGTLLGTIPVNSTSLTENTFGRDYTAMFDGMNVVVAKEGTANFIVKADIVDTLPTSLATYTLAIDQTNAIRGIDGIGLSQYVNDASAYNRTVTFTASTSGHVTVVANGSNPLTMNVVTSATNVTTGITGLVFDLQNTSKYDVQIKTLTATLGNNNTTVSGYYLYDGSNMIMSVGNPNSTTLSFTNLPSNFTVAANSTKTLTIKFDVAAAGAGSQTVSVAYTGITAVDMNSNLLLAGTDLVGSATGLPQTFQSTGVIVNLVSATATSVPSTTGVSGYATGTFVFTVKANGVNLAKLSTSVPAYIAALVAPAGASLANINYTVSPDTIVSDGSQVTVTLTTTKTTVSPGNVNFVIGSLAFEKSDLSGLTTPITTGLDNFHSTVWAN